MKNLTHSQKEKLKQKAETAMGKLVSLGAQKFSINLQNAQRSLRNYIDNDLK